MKLVEVDGLKSYCVKVKDLQEAEALVKAVEQVKKESNRLGQE